jgi:cytochrome c
MKSMLIVLAAAASLAAAGAANAQAKPEDLIKSSGCANCHDVATKKVGPAFKEIAAKFKGKADAQKTLVDNLKAGKGHPPVKASDADLATMVKYVLAQ